MSSKDQNLNQINSSLPTAAGKKIAIVTADWNKEITHSMAKAAKDILVKQLVAEDDIYEINVPGTFELPKGAKLAHGQFSPDGIICIGCVITGETKHDEYISSAVAQGIMMLNISLSIPVIFGVLTPRTVEQAKDRAGGQYGNKGVEAATTLLKMLHLEKELKGNQKRIGF